MHLHKALLIPLYFLTLASWGQTLQGTVLDQETGDPIPFVNAYNITTQQGQYVNEKGVFAIQTSLGDSIRFSCMGYAPLIWVATQEQTTIRLTPIEITLPEVVISSVSPTTQQIGYHKKRTIGSVFLSPEQEIAMYLASPYTENKRILKVFIRMLPNEVETLFRVHLYENLAGAPGLEIPLPNRVYSSTDIRRKIFTVELSDQWVFLASSGIFIGIEVIGFSTEEGITFEELPDWSLASIKADFKSEAIVFRKLKKWFRDQWMDKEKAKFPEHQFCLGLEVAE